MAVLLVDDDRDLAEALREALQLERVELHVAENAEAALELAAERAPQLVLVDYHLPNVEPRELITRLREVSDAPIYLCTGLDARQLAVETGADGALEKPFRIEKLLGLLEARRRRQPAATP